MSNAVTKRKYRIIGTLIFSLVLLVWARGFWARAYMREQIERLARQGSPGYEIFDCNYLSFSDCSGFPCITLKARRTENPKDAYGEEYDSIAVDFPWIPFMAPEHRI